MSHVLIISDDKFALFVLNDLVEEAGFRVSILTYFDHSLEEIKQISPEIIVLDYQWTGIDNGWSLLQLLRLDPATASVPIVLCTGAANEATALQEHLDSVNVTVVLKPYLAATLLSAIADRDPSNRAARLDGSSATTRD